MFHFPDLLIYLGIYYIDLDAQFNSYPVSKKVKHCSFPTVPNIFTGMGSYHLINWLSAIFC